MELQVAKAAEEYIKKAEFNSLDEDDKLFEAYIAGAESRQKEIDELVEFVRASSKPFGILFSTAEENDVILLENSAAEILKKYDT